MIEVPDLNSGVNSKGEVFCVDDIYQYDDNEGHSFDVSVPVGQVATASSVEVGETSPQVTIEILSEKAQDFLDAYLTSTEELHQRVDTPIRGTRYQELVSSVVRARFKGVLSQEDVLSILACVGPALKAQQELPIYDGKDDDKPKYRDSQSAAAHDYS